LGGTRKLAAILVADVVGYSRLAAVDEDRTLARLRGLRSDLIDPAIAAHHGRIVKRTGDGNIVEFRSAVDAVRCAIEVQAQRRLDARTPHRVPHRCSSRRRGQEADGDLMGDGVNIAARLEGIAKPGAICVSEDTYRQVKTRLELTVTRLGSAFMTGLIGGAASYNGWYGWDGYPAAVAWAAANRRLLASATLVVTSTIGTTTERRVGRATAPGVRVGQWPGGVALNYPHSRVDLALKEQEPLR
jgi:hypothetical protein